MHKCGEERRRLAAEWAEFFAQQKLSKERAEREVERALQADAQREGTLISLAKVEPGRQPALSLQPSRLLLPQARQLSTGHSNSNPNSDNSSAVLLLHAHAQSPHHIPMT